MPWTNNSTDTALSAVPDNGGIGFIAWTSSESGGASSGYFLGSSNEYDGGNINSSDFFTASGTSFGMYGVGSGNNAYAYRKILQGLMVGGFITFKIAIQFRNGAKGIRFFRNGTPTFYFQASNDDRYEYSLDGSTWTDTLWGYNGRSVFTVRAHRTSESNISYTVSRDGTADTFTVNSSTSTDIDEVAIFVENTNSGGQNNIYFNFLSAFNNYRL